MHVVEFTSTAIVLYKVFSVELFPLVILLRLSHLVSGLLRDVTGSFDVPYLYFGIACLITTTLLLLEPCARRFDDRKSCSGKDEEASLTVDAKKV